MLARYTLACNACTRAACYHSAQHPADARSSNATRRSNRQVYMVLNTYIYMQLDRLQEDIKMRSHKELIADFMAEPLSEEQPVEHPADAPSLKVEQLVEHERAHTNATTDTDLQSMACMQEQIDEALSERESLRAELFELREQVMKLAYELFELKNQIGDVHDVRVPTVDFESSPREKQLARMSAYNDAHRDEINQKMRAYYAAHRDEISARRRELRNRS